ncbi:hypothetical protein L1049_020977 [Liquidambar formosana]|uniref:Uncharacterized protein n=1 Tax=Liquidambar formosana TaxID=63359 RepID=A0AAP0SC71_LIQFO
MTTTTTTTNDDESMGGDDSLNMIMDMPDSLSNSKPADMSVDEPRPTEAAEAEDGWVVVASKRNRGKRN